MSDPDRRDTRTTRVLATYRSFEALAAALEPDLPDSGIRIIEISALEFGPLTGTMAWHRQVEDTTTTEGVQVEDDTIAGNFQP